MKGFNIHFFHLVDERPWPLTRSISAFFMTLGLVDWFNTGSYLLLALGVFRILMSIYQ